MQRVCQNNARLISVGSGVWGKCGDVYNHFLSFKKKMGYTQKCFGGHQGKATAFQIQKQKRDTGWGSQSQK